MVPNLALSTSASPARPLLTVSRGFGYVTTQHTEGGTGEKAINAAGPESTSTSYQGVTGSAPVAGHASAASPRPPSILILLCLLNVP